MLIIPLTKGFGTTVDERDYIWLMKYTWYAAGPEGRPARRIVNPRRTIIFMYHQILGVWPWRLRDLGLCVDHIDRNPLNNCRDNLRIVNAATNMQNTSRAINRVGVCFDNTHRKWKAYVDSPNKPRINVGTFKTREEAEIALAVARSAL